MYYADRWSVYSVSDRINSATGFLLVDKSGMSFCKASSDNPGNVKTEISPIQIRQVPGDGFCLFHAITVGLYYYQTGNHFPYDDFTKLHESSRTLRFALIDFFRKSRDEPLFGIDGEMYSDSSELLRKAASTEGVASVETYLRKIERGAIQAGGPELVGLANMLRQPITLYRVVNDVGKNQLKIQACFGNKNGAPKQSLHILIANRDFPHVIGEGEEDNHFLAVFVP